MTDWPETDVEILVHISAPSGARDDARYRKQAQAFLGFETARRHIILGPQHKHVETEITAIDAPNTIDREKLETKRHGAQPTSDQQHQGHAGPSVCALRSPVLPSSPQDRPQTAPSAATPPFTDTRSVRRTQSDSWGTPPSVVPDSQPLIPAVTPTSTASPIRPSLSPQSPVEERSAKRRRIETAAVLPRTIPALSPFASAVGTDSLFAPVASLQLPSAPSPSDKLHSRPTRPSPSTPPAPQIQVSSSRPQQQPPRPNTLLRPSSINQSPTVHHQPSAPHPSSPSPPTLPPDSDALAHTKILTIHPQPPPTTSKPFKTHITASLALIAKHAELPKRYRPTLATRPLRPLERGHWRLDCTSFPPQLRKKMWKFLTDFVGQGRAGWGVWCELSILGPEGPHRELHVVGVEDPLGKSRGDRVDGDTGRGDEPREEGVDGTEKEMKKGTGRAELKIYCWGEVVPHIYIVLFLATSRMVKGAGASWVGGAGEVVVRMP